MASDFDAVLFYRIINNQHTEIVVTDTAIAQWNRARKLAESQVQSRADYIAREELRKFSRDRKPRQVRISSSGVSIEWADEGRAAITG